jgi:hypothetical protein
MTGSICVEDIQICLKPKSMWLSVIVLRMISAESTLKN